MGTTFCGSALVEPGGTPSYWSDFPLPEENLALSKRELEVLRLVGDGLSNDEIGMRLLISPHTVHRHVSTILDKLDARNRIEAFAISLREGLVPCPRLCQYHFAGTA